MTTTMEQYLDEVLSSVPSGPRRDQIELDLRSQLTRAIQPGSTVDDVVRRFGPPRDLAELYLADAPLEPASVFSRLIAALIDIPGVVLFGALLFYFGWNLIGPKEYSWLTGILTGNAIAMGLCIATLMVVTPGYYITCESTTGQTIGKALMNIRVVRESGTKISVGQAIVRQIPMICNFLWLDALFALFTEKKQRAFELISKTRVVKADN